MTFKSRIAPQYTKGRNLHCNICMHAFQRVRYKLSMSLRFAQTVQSGDFVRDGRVTLQYIVKVKFHNNLYSFST